jgi:hypothetical protein
MIRPLSLTRVSSATSTPHTSQPHGDSSRPSRRACHTARYVCRRSSLSTINRRGRAASHWDDFHCLLLLAARETQDPVANGGQQALEPSDAAARERGAHRPPLRTWRRVAVAVRRHRGRRRRGRRQVAAQRTGVVAPPRSAAGRSATDPVGLRPLGRSHLDRWPRCRRARAEVSARRRTLLQQLAT